MRSSIFIACCFAVPVVAACSSPDPSDETEQASSAAFSDVVSLVKDGSGTYSATCRDGRVEGAVTIDRLQAGDVCAPAPVSDLFDPALCTGPALTRAEALALGRFDVLAGKTLHKLGKTTHAVRQRDCTLSGACGSWRTVRGPEALIADGYSAHGMPREAVFPLSQVEIEQLLDVELLLELVSNAPRVRLAGSVEKAPSPGAWAWEPSFVFDGALRLLNRADRSLYRAKLGATVDHFAKTPGLRAKGFELRGKVTASCARYGAAYSVTQKDSNGNMYLSELELVIHAAYP